jgi:endonuclease/exonuclease/phosphatase family metal-dependent hydrolase
MKTIYSLFFIALISVFIFSCKGEKVATAIKYDSESVSSDYRIMFYNVENLFDTEDDPEKNDNEFLPEGDRYWSDYRYKQKLSNIYKVITAVGGWDLPMLVGLCEVENRTVLDGLLNYTPLYKSDYKIIHYESPDARGIDVALLYRSELFTPISHKPIRVTWPKDIGSGTTRDILYTCGVTNKGDTLHIFVNHWPSRWGGQLETEEKRMFVAKLVKNATDSIFETNSQANIIVMGDLNDHPTDRSVLETLNAQTSFDKIVADKLYNLSYYIETVKKQGSHKYQGKWGVLDQIIVSGGLLDDKGVIYTTPEDAYIFDAEFLLEPDEKYTGTQVNRTYIGFKYHGGFSDHLPIYLDIKRR